MTLYDFFSNHCIDILTAFLAFLAYRKFSEPSLVSKQLDVALELTTAAHQLAVSINIFRGKFQHHAVAIDNIDWADWNQFINHEQNFHLAVKKSSLIIGDIPACHTLVRLSGATRDILHNIMSLKTPEFIKGKNKKTLVEAHTQIVNNNQGYIVDVSAELPFNLSENITQALAPVIKISKFRRIKALLNWLYNKLPK